MMMHVVLFAPRPDLGREEQEALVSAFETAAREIPSVRRAKLARRVVHGEGYEARMPAAFRFAAILEFDDLEGLRAYLAHPAHERLGACFNDSLESALVYDYEAGDASEVRRWLTEPSESGGATR
jgi:hypothetical protein